MIFIKGPTCILEIILYPLSLNFDNFIEDIFYFMKLFLSDSKKSKILMKGSIKKFSEKFSEKVWAENFQKILKKTKIYND